MHIYVLLFRNILNLIDKISKFQQQGAVCEFFWKTTLVSYPISLAAQTSSVWTCVAITVDR